MEETPSNEGGGTPSSEPVLGKPKPPPRRPRIRRRRIRADRVWRARFLLICGTLAGMAVLAMLARPTGDPHIQEALVPGGETGTRTVTGSALYKIAGCKAPDVLHDDERGRQPS